MRPRLASRLTSLCLAPPSLCLAPTPCSDLNHNRLEGRIPEAWAWGRGFQAVVEFDVSHNQLTGPFPAVAYTNTSFMKLQAFNVGHNRMS